MLDKIQNIFNGSVGYTPTPLDVLIKLMHYCYSSGVFNPSPFWSKVSDATAVAFLDNLAELETPIKVDKDLNAQYATDIQIITFINKCADHAIPGVNAALQAFLTCYPYYSLNVRPAYVEVLNPKPFGVDALIIEPEHEPLYLSTLYNRLFQLPDSDDLPNQIVGCLDRAYLNNLRSTEDSKRIRAKLSELISKKSEEYRLKLIIALQRILQSDREIECKILFEAVLRDCIAAITDVNKTLLLKENGITEIKIILHTFILSSTVAQEELIDFYLLQLSNVEKQMYIFQVLTTLSTRMSVSSKKKVIVAALPFVSTSGDYCIRAIGLVNQCFDMQDENFLNSYVELINDNNNNVLSEVASKLNSIFKNLSHDLQQKIITLAIARIPENTNAHLFHLLSVAVSFIPKNKILPLLYLIPLQDEHMNNHMLVGALVAWSADEDKSLAIQFLLKNIVKLNSYYYLGAVVFGISNVSFVLPKDVKNDFINTLKSWLASPAKVLSNNTLKCACQLAISNPEIFTLLMQQDNISEFVATSEDLAKIIPSLTQDQAKTYFAALTHVVIYNPQTTLFFQAMAKLAKYNIVISEDTLVTRFLQIFEECKKEMSFSQLCKHVEKIPRSIHAELIGSLINLLAEVADEPKTFIIHILIDFHKLCEDALKKQILAAMLPVINVRNVAIQLVHQLDDHARVLFFEQLIQVLSQACNSLEYMAYEDNQRPDPSLQKFINIMFELIAKIITLHSELLIQCSNSFKIFMQHLIKINPEKFESTFVNLDTAIKKQYYPYLVLANAVDGTPSVNRALESLRFEYDVFAAVPVNTSIYQHEVIATIHNYARPRGTSL